MGGWRDGENQNSGNEDSDNGTFALETIFV